MYGTLTYLNHKTNPFFLKDNKLTFKYLVLRGEKISRTSIEKFLKGFQR